MAKGECPGCGKLLSEAEIKVVKGLRRYKCEACKSNGYLGKAEKAGQAQKSVPVPEVPNEAGRVAEARATVQSNGNGATSGPDAGFFDW